jgi:hypothetical protein
MREGSESGKEGTSRRSLERKKETVDKHKWIEYVNHFTSHANSFAI